MLSTMMHTPMTVRMIFEYGSKLFPRSRICSFDGEKIVCENFFETTNKVGQLANALSKLGVKAGDRVGTFSWNNTEHMQAYLAVPSMGAVMHTINIRLSPEQIAYVINHAQDKVLIVDGELLNWFEPVWPLLKTVEHVLITKTREKDVPKEWLNYDSLIQEFGSEFLWPTVDENSAAAICYTSGTTGNPKGVVYSHRTTFMHSLASRTADTFGISEADRILLLPSMFHANAWGLPYSGWLSGSDFVLPGRHVQLEAIRKMIASEQPTFTAMVPTVLGDLLHAPEEKLLDMSSFRMLVCGGSAVAPSLIDEAKKVWGVPVLQGWGMTETSPLCALSHPPKDCGDQDQTIWRAKSGRPVPGVEVRLQDEVGNEVANDGVSIGELQLRGPWITGSYHLDESAESFTDDGWLRTGDVGYIDERYFIQLTDRTKDVIKSGGEWISSVDLENVLLGHAGVKEVAVVGISDKRWQERPLALIVCQDCDLSAEVLREFLVGKVAKFWIPEYWVFTDEIPKTSVGKIDKKLLRKLSVDGSLDIIIVK